MPRAPYTSPLAKALAPGLLERFLRYVRVDTQSRRERDRSPSTPGQLELGQMLVAELKEAGLADAQLDENGYVFATLPARPGARSPATHDDPLPARPGARSPATPNDAPPDAPTEDTIGLIAHLDTSPDAPAAGIEPLVHHAYDGAPLTLPHNGTTLNPDQMLELRQKRGHDLVTSSGDTLLGADDKAGVAAIMTAVAHLAANPDLPRPPIRIAFTPDEEIGEGATLFDIDRFGARCAYTIDGSDLGELQDETFSADEVILTIEGIDVHPGQATGKLVNALRLASKVVAALPSDALTPETTSGRQGFIHPYELTGTPARARARAIVRDFDDELLASHVELLESTARDFVNQEPRARLEIDVRRQYRNMRRHLEAVPEVTAAAEAAIRAEGIEPVRVPVRGGTDGSRLSEMGLPTPNIFTGAHEFHSVREWASLQDMAASAATIVRLAEVWSRTAA